MVPGGQREQWSGRIRRGCERQFQFEWYDYPPRSEWDGFHTWQFGGSALTVYTVFNGWPQAIWANSVKRLRSLRRQREGIKPGNSESREQLSAKWESITSYRHNSKVSHEKYIYKYIRRAKHIRNWWYLAMSVYNVGYICFHLISLLRISLWDFWFYLNKMEANRFLFISAHQNFFQKVFWVFLFTNILFTLLWRVHKNIVNIIDRDYAISRKQL